MSPNSYVRQRNGGVSESCHRECAWGDAVFIAKALVAIARAKGMPQVARDAHLSRESLYKALSGERNSSLDMVLKVLSWA